MSTAIDKVSKKSPGATTPWWRVGMVWFVIAGPSIVVLAGGVTMKLALSHADVVVQETPAAAQGGALTPALKARNHAASPRP